MKRIYLDNAATTAVSNEVLTEMLPAFNETFGNPNSLHSFGRDSLNLVDKARDRIAEGINADGPIPPDTIFSKARGGWYDIVVAMYHDQGHIPLKVCGFVYNQEAKKWDAVAGVNITLGLPIIRTSVDHGTAFDQAGTGEANQLSLINAIEYAVKLAENRWFYETLFNNSWRFHRS